MQRLSFAILSVLFAVPGFAQYNYHRPTELLVTLGTQAFMICNGRFTSNRPLDLIYEQELKLDRMPVVPPHQVAIDETARTVAVGVGGNFPAPVMRAAYREGLGCIVLAPDQDFDDVGSLPELKLPPPPGDAATIPWPNGDLIVEKPLPAGVDAKALEAAWDWTFDRAKHGHPSQITLSLVVVHRGDIVLERYAPGVDRTTRTRTWSTAKSIASALIGIAVAQGKLSLDSPVPYDEGDPRRSITLRNVLHMSSGLEPVDNEKCAVVGSCLSYWAGASSVEGALGRGLVAPSGHLLGLRELRHAHRGPLVEDGARGKGLSGVSTKGAPRQDRNAQHDARSRPLRGLHPEQPGLYQRARSGSLRPPVS